MRFLFAAVLVMTSLVVVGCATAAPGWHGADVHLVDGVWIGTERTCRDDADDQRCRAIVAEALRLIGPEQRARVARAQLAALPTTFVTLSGETRTARLGGGITSWEAVVLDLVDGHRQVVPLACHAIKAATCRIGSLHDWLDGNAPPSIPPGAIFG